MTDPPTWVLSRWLVVRGLALVHLVAFVSLWVQIEGLIGSRGILPVEEVLATLDARLGAEAYRVAPTLLWLDASDAALHGLCAAGVVLAVLLAVGVAPVSVLLALWIVYLSLSVGGQTFLSFQWDTLLLESTLVALFYAPGGLWRPAPGGAGEPSRAGRWLVWALVFKLMVLSGAVKLLSLDETWWNGTALEYHYWTQPLPTWTAWIAHRFVPAWLDRITVAAMFLIEIGAPFAIVLGRLSRRAAGLALIGLQAAIALTGNYGFFNLLSAVLCLSLLDDTLLSRLTPRRWRDAVMARVETGLFVERERWRAGPIGRQARRRAAAAAFAVLALSALTFVDELAATASRARLPGVPGRVAERVERALAGSVEPWMLRWIAPFRSINGYGLFRRMTTTRPEIVIEGSDDGRTWQEYAFRFKPGDPQRRPRFVAPHMPRLDWQMWFAALRPEGATHWLEPLLRHLLDGTPEVAALLGEVPPFENGLPRFVRLVEYRYEFASPSELRERGLWWRRTRVGPLTPPLSREQR